MKKILTKVIAVLLVVLMAAVYVPVGELSSVFTVEASAATSNGSLGGNVKWSYDTKTKVITVSGSGAMKDFKSATDGQNFHKLVIGSTQYPNKDATKIVINEGVTYIGQNAFRSLTGVKEVSIPSSVTSIGRSAFEGCSALTTVNLTESLTAIGAYAFKSTKFASVKMPYSVKSVGEHAFNGISGLKITCNYGDAAYNYCKTYNAAYTLRTPAVVCESSFDAAKNQIVLTVKVKDASGLNAANFTVTYNDAVKPVSTDYTVDDFDASSDVKTAVVYNETGKISIASIAQDCIPYAACGSQCSYTIATLTFTANSEADTADFTVTPTVMMANGSRVTASAASESVDLHVYRETSVTPATCKTEGVRVYTCSLCGKVKKETIAKDPSNHEGGTELRGAVAATCTAKGYSGDTVCLGCGAVITAGKELGKTAHTYEVRESVASTCQEKGYTTYVCSVCGDTYTQEAAELGAHDYQAVVTEPTCTQAGYTIYTCSVCGDSYKGDLVSALGHDYDENGVCKRCGDVNVVSVTFVDGSSWQVNEETGIILSTKTATAQSLLDSIVSGKWTAQAADGATLSGDAVLATGSVLKNENGKTYRIAILGDVNQDGKVAASDARIVLRTAASLEQINDVQKAAADCDYNGKISATDARKILRVAANLDKF